MNRNTFITPRFVIHLLVCILAIAYAFAQSTEQLNSLSLRIHCSKQELLLVEPIVLQVEITNVAATNQFLLTEFRNGVGWADYMISQDDVHFEIIQPLTYRDPVGRRILLATNETYYHEETFSFDSRQNGLVCPVPGDYYFRVDYRGLKSNVVKIHVKEPETVADKKWAEALKARDVLMTLQIPGWKSGNVVKTLTECTRETTTYSPYAAYTLASTETNKTNALALYEKADIAGFPLQQNAVFGKARVNEELSNLQAARQDFERILNEFPTTAAAAEARKRLATMLPIR